MRNNLKTYCVIPAKAGIHLAVATKNAVWIHAFAGMTVKKGCWNE